MSSSRVHCTFTGAPAAFDSSAASTAKSGKARRPKPPPRSVTWTFVFFAPTAPPAEPAFQSANCVGSHISSPSAV